MDKGGLISSQSRKIAGRERLVLWVATAMQWVAASALIVVPGLSRDGAFRLNDISIPFALAFIVVGLFLASKAWKFRPLCLYENGIDGFPGYGFTSSFKRYREIEKAEVVTNRKWISILFWAKGFASLAVERKEANREKLRKIADFLRSKGVRLSISEEAKDWLIQCPSCGRFPSIKHVYHAGFSNSGFLYCDRCTNVLVFSSFDPNFESIVGKKHPWTLNEEERRAVERALVDCPCGGKFSFENPLRCPHCNASVRGPLFETIYYNVVGQVLDGDKQNVWKSREAKSE